MIDPITAFAVAQGAIKGVQAAIKMGKEINAISGDLMKFFEAKDVVAKAVRAEEISDIINFGLWTALVSSIVGLVAWLTWQIVGDGR